MPERRWRISLAALFGVVLGGLLAIAVGAVLTLEVIANARNTLTLLNEKAVLLVGQLRTDVTSRLQPIAQTLTTLQEIVERNAAGLDQPSDLLVEGILAGAPHTKAFVLYDREFRPQGMIRDESGEFVRWAPGETVTDIVVETLRGMAPDDPPRWGVPIAVEGETYLHAAVPLAKDGELTGYAGAAIAGHLVFERFAAIAEIHGATPFLIHGDSSLILGGTDSPPRCDDGCPALMPLDQVRDPVLRRFAQRRKTAAFGRALESGVAVSFLEGDETTGEQDYVLVTEEVRTLEGLPITLGVYLPEADVSTEMRRLIGSAAAGALIALIAIVVAVLIGRRLARAVGRTAREARHVATLRFDAIDEVPRSRIAELDVQAQAFNAMTEALRTFARYVPAGLVRRLIAEGYSAAARSEVRPAAVMFTDIVGFTALSERMSAQKSADLLNRHFAMVVEAVDETGGVVDKFMGDGSMSFWALPDGAGHECEAVAAAMRIGRGIARDLDEARARGEPGLRVRIGIHAGDVIVGNVGPPDRVNYTVIGDSVNVAARLEQLGRAIAPDDDCVIVVSDAVATALPETVARDPAGSFQLRNRAETVGVWRIRLDDDEVVQDGSDEPPDGRQGGTARAERTAGARPGR